MSDFVVSTGEISRGRKVVINDIIISGWNTGGGFINSIYISLTNHPLIRNFKKFKTLISV